MTCSGADSRDVAGPRRPGNSQGGGARIYTAEVRFLIVAGVVLACLIPPRPVVAQADLHAPLDRILDTYVRDGLVYYNALRIERRNLDRYVASLDIPAAQLAQWPRDRQLAFWINAYNALVLRTVIDAYPIRGKAPEYPPGSIRQIPGAFGTHKHRAGGASLTLDEIEMKVAGFGDARALLALGRGAVGSPRLRSEAYREATLDAQLGDVVKECAVRSVCTSIDRATSTLSINAIFGWRQEQFVASFAASGGQWANRTPIERAVVAMIHPHLFSTEREILALNNFKVVYHDFDWTLNDLGRARGPAAQ
jgi:hypothetical protein